MFPLTWCCIRTRTCRSGGGGDRNDIGLHQYCRGGGG